MFVACLEAVLAERLAPRLRLETHALFLLVLRIAAISGSPAHVAEVAPECAWYSVSCLMPS